MTTAVRAGKKNRRRKTPLELFLSVLTIAFLALMVFFTLYPIVYTVLGSFKTNMELTGGGGFFPKEWHWENYVTAFIQADFITYTKNSILTAGLTTLLATSTCAMAGYTMARREFFGKKLWSTLYVVMMFVSLGSVTLYPIYEMLRAVNLHKSILGLVFALTGGQAANVMLVTGFVRGVPRELDEAATIDGCSFYGIFVRVILPLIKPILAVVALFAFRNAWNDYITTLIMTITTPKLQTLTVAVVQLKYSMNAAAEWHIMLAGASIAIIPILLVYAICNKQFIAGLTAGAVKG